MLKNFSRLGISQKKIDHKIVANDKARTKILDTIAEVVEGIKSNI